MDYSITSIIRLGELYDYGGSSTYMSVIFSKLLKSVWVILSTLFNDAVHGLSCHVLFVVRDKRALGHRFVSQKTVD